MRGGLRFEDGWLTVLVSVGARIKWPSETHYASARLRVWSVALLPFISFLKHYRGSGGWGLFSWLSSKQLDENKRSQLQDATNLE